jgi:hypothetical protein
MTDLEPGGPYSPERTAEVANTAAKAIRYLNVATLDSPREAITCPQDLDRVVASLATLAQRMPQLLGQLARWQMAEAAATRTEVAYGKYEGRPELAAQEVRTHLDDATVRFDQAAKALKKAQQITSAITSGGSDEGQADG